MVVVHPASYAQEGDGYRLLIEQVIAGNGLSGVVRLLSDMLGLPATVADDDLEPLHAFAPRGRHLSPEEAALSPELRGRIAFDVSGEPQASTAPPTMRAQSKDGLEHAIAPVVLPTGILGYVWVTDPSGHMPSRVDEAVSHAAAACAVEMVRLRALLEGESRVRSSFLEDLLSGAVSSINSTRRRARFLGYDLRGEQVVFTLDMDRFSSYIDRYDMTESDIQRIKERFRRSIDSSIPAIWSRTLIWEHSDSMVVLAPAGKEYNPHTFRERVETLRANVERRLGGPGISAGIGRAYVDLTRLQHSYQEAEHALRIGVAVFGPSMTSAFDDLGAYRLLYHLRDQPELRTFCDETIGALTRYDDEHEGHLLETLTTYLELQGNLSQTARALHLHRNGVIYRLARIEKIAECDLNVPAQRLALQLALLARPLLEPRSRSDKTRRRREG
jgi:purine catabolism regulator